MTVRVTTLKGADAGAYYVEQLPNYYLAVRRAAWHLVRRRRTAARSRRARSTTTRSWR